MDFTVSYEESLLYLIILSESQADTSPFGGREKEFLSTIIPEDLKKEVESSSQTFMIAITFLALSTFSERGLKWLMILKLHR